MNKNDFLSGVKAMTGTRKRIYLIGLVITLLITLNLLIRLFYNNYQIFAYGSIDFWKGINPYTEWDHLSARGKPLSPFLYGPLFSVLFIPFAALPDWPGLFCWNVFSYTLFFLSVFSLPDKFSFDDKRFIFFFSSLMLFFTLFSVQFNPVVGAIFLFSFSLLERKQGFWAVFLILLSGLIKVYGIFQLVMLLFYPGFLKNVLYAFFIGIVLILLPALNIPPGGLTEYYQSWILKIASHSGSVSYFSIYRPFFPIFHSLRAYTGIISAGVFIILTFLVFLRLKSFRESFYHRARFLGILMSWVILFSTGSEKHTYVIALAGYAIWYLCTEHNKADKILLWLNFILLAILPIDILCPWVISNFLLVKLNLGILVFAVTWVIMVYKTFASETSLKGEFLGGANE